MVLVAIPAEVGVVAMLQDELLARKSGGWKQTQAPLSTRMDFTHFIKPRPWKLSQSPKTSSSRPVSACPHTE